MSKRHRRKKTKRSGAYIGGYVAETVKQKLQAEAERLDRPLSWLIEKILAEGVKHPIQQPSELKQAA